MLNLNNKFLEGLAADYAIKNWIDYCFNINSFYLPERIITNNNNKINLEYNRKLLMKQANSPYAENMKNYLINNNIKFIQEFIIVIENKYLWDSIIDHYNLPEEKKIEYKKINYFSLDFLLIDNMICIEVDSNFHKNRKTLDNARDFYIKTHYGIETIRFFKFGENKKKDQEGINKINQQMTIKTNTFNYLSIIANNFIYENKYTLIMIDRFIDSLGNRFYTDWNFVITEKDLNNFANGIVFGTGINPISFESDFTELTKNLINKNIFICKNIINYGISEIYYILNRLNSQINIRRDILSKYGFSPYWIARLINIPPDLTQFIKQETGEDTFLLNYIQNGIIR